MWKLLGFFSPSWANFHCYAVLPLPEVSASPIAAWSLLHRWNVLKKEGIQVEVLRPFGQDMNFEANNLEPQFSTSRAMFERFGRQKCSQQQRTAKEFKFNTSEQISLHMLDIHAFAHHYFTLDPVLSTQHPRSHRAWDFMPKLGRSQLLLLSPIGWLVDINNIDTIYMISLHISLISSDITATSLVHTILYNCYVCRVCLLFQSSTLIVDSLHHRIEKDTGCLLSIIEWLVFMWATKNF